MNKITLLLFICSLGALRTTAQEKFDYTNALSSESSPYLIGHAHNPVNWKPWGEKALQLARKENKLLIVSIGYAACHWCHVMEKETFSDTTVANFMNKYFVSIKVDREERPDVDKIYMDAVQLITGGGGWPLNAFALSDGKAFHAGTYFTKEQWMRLLQLIVKTYSADPEKVEAQANALAEGIRSLAIPETGTNESLSINGEHYEKYFSPWLSTLDTEWGGYTRVPKFPLPSTWESLLQYHYISGDSNALRAVTTTLDRMALGGIYDQLNGGFARYSTDKYWKVPHFEKMLYDNGQLVSLYAHAFQLTGNPLYESIVKETLGFVKRELTAPSGGFYSSINADSEGEEGKYYVWTKKEIETLLGNNSSTALFSEYYQVSTSGNWESGKNILFPSQSKVEFASQKKIDKSDFINKMNDSKVNLQNAQKKRIRPSTDDKVLVSWNALMLKGYIDAFKALGDENYLHTAIRNAEFLESRMTAPDGSLFRNFKNGKATIPAFLDDYALFGDALIELYQVTYNIHWLELAKKLTTFAEAHFYSKENNLFFYTSDQAGETIVRQMEILDNVIPSSNSVMAHNLYRLGLYFDENHSLTLAEAMVKRVLPSPADQNQSNFANWIRLTGMMTASPYEVAIVGNDFQKKSRELQQYYLPTSLFMGGQKENLPLLEMKLIQGKTMIYVCKNKVCKMPVTEVSLAKKILVP